MSGILGFVRHQEISVLCSAHVPPNSSSKAQNQSPPVAQQTSTSSAISSHSKDTTAPEVSAPPTSSQISSSSANFPQSGLSPCGKPHWITYQYFSTENGSDHTLGVWLRDLAMRRTIPCETPGCKYMQGQHERRLIHDGVRVVIRLGEADEDVIKKEKEMEEDEITPESGEDIFVWESCAVCDAKTSQTWMNDGAL